VGAWLSVFREEGVHDVLGIDGDYVRHDLLLIPGAQFRSHDLSHPLTLDRDFDLALCLEVAEHIPAEAAPTLVKSLVALARLVLFSAAIPGQYGVDHVNEQWPSYWANLFSTHGFRPIDLLRGAIWDDESVDWWYRQNMLLYVGSGVEIEAIKPMTVNPTTRVVHPAAVTGLHESAFAAELTLRELARRLPAAARRSLQHRIRSRKPACSAEE